MASPWHLNKIFGKWDALIGQTPSHSDTPYLRGMWAYSLGSAYANTGDLDSASEQLQILKAIVDEREVDKTRVTVTSVSGILTLAAHGLEGEIKEARGDFEGAITSYVLAVELEDKGNYTEPPAWAQPMRHYLGAVLLKAGHPEDAEKFIVAIYVGMLRMVGLFMACMSLLLLRVRRRQPRLLLVMRRLGSIRILR